MRLEWLEDLVAIFETGSLNAASERRFLTQPAFSRRVRAIEDYLGVELLDRSRKPARPNPVLERREKQLREVTGALRELVRDLRRNDPRIARTVVIASQHAITTSVLPSLIAREFAGIGAQIGLRSANRAECTAMLITKEADLTLTYRSAAEMALPSEEYVETRILGEERLVPVCAPGMMAALEAGQLDLIAYPPEVFLGAFMEKILSEAAQRFVVEVRVETALTLAALQLAMAGVGVAWVPDAMAHVEIQRGGVVELSHMLPDAGVTLVATRLIGPKSELEEAIWAKLPKGGAWS